MEEILNKVMQRLKQMSPEDLSKEIDKHKDGDFCSSLERIARVL